MGDDDIELLLQLIVQKERNRIKYQISVSDIRLKLEDK
jgi:hypothetical protein